MEKRGRKMGKCKNKVTQTIPRGYGYKEVLSRCGSTGIHGEQLICDECEERLKKQYPQGWRNTPGDICKHGTYVGDYCGPDYICGKCENGE
jgi:hypothetical protein